MARYAPHAETNRLINDFVEVGWQFENRARHYVVRDPSNPANFFTFHKGTAGVRRFVFRKARRMLEQARALDRITAGPGQLHVELPPNAPAAMHKKLANLRNRGIFLKDRT